MPEIQPGQKAVLQAAWVYGAAEVKLNGKEAGALLIPPFELELTPYLQAGKNQLELLVTPALHNRLAKKAQDLMPAGVLGPVKVLIFNQGGSHD